MLLSCAAGWAPGTVRGIFSNGAERSAGSVTPRPATFEAWVEYLDATTGTLYIKMTTTAGEELILSTVVSCNLWTEIAVVYDMGKATLYKDCAEIMFDEIDGSSENLFWMTNCPLTIGVAQMDKYWSGGLDNIKMCREAFQHGTAHFCPLP